MKRILFAIFIFALFLRLFAVIAQEESRRLPLSDAKQYDKIAVNIVSGNGLSQVLDGPRVPTSKRTPIYPLFLAGIYAIFGHNYFAVKVIQAIIGGIFCIVVFFITFTIYNDKKTAIISSLLTAIYKPFVSGVTYYGGPAYLLSEYLYMFILGIAVLMVILFIKRGNKKFGILSGIFIGVAILTRAEFILFPILLLFYLFYLTKLSIKKTISKYFVIYLFVILTIVPWGIRNYIIQGKFILLHTYGGQAFWWGNNTLTRGGWAFPPDYDETMVEVKDISEYEQNRIFFKKGIEELKTNPRRIPKLLIKKILVHWAPFEQGFKIGNPYYAVILLFGAIGILFFRKRNNLEYVLLILLLMTTLIAMVMFGDPRFRYSYESFLIIFAALAINGIFNITNWRKKWLWSVYS